MGKWYRNCVFSFTCGFINIINTFTAFGLLLLLSDNCENKISEQVSSDDDFMSVFHNCEMGFLACPVIVYHHCCELYKHFDWFVGKNFNSLFCFVVIHFADGVVRSILFASVLVIRLTTLPESILAFACTFPYCILAFKGSSWFAESQEMAAT